MCGCTKNQNRIAGEAGLTMAELVASGQRVWVEYRGRHKATTRRGPVTNERYSVDHVRCVPMRVEDWKHFDELRTGEFALCDGKSGGSTEPLATPAKVVGPVTKLAPVTRVVESVVAKLTGQPKPVEVEPTTKPVADVVDISELTVVNALPLIDKADANMLDLYEEQESDKDTGERSTIMAAIERRRAELNEAK